MAAWRGQGPRQQRQWQWTATRCQGVQWFRWHVSGVVGGSARLALQTWVDTLCIVVLIDCMTAGPAPEQTGILASWTMVRKKTPLRIFILVVIVIVIILVVPPAG